MIAPDLHPPDYDEAARFLSLLDETAEAFCFRVFDDNENRKDPRLAAKYQGTLADCWPALLAAQAKGCGVYVVANAGEQTNDTIYRVRVVFADTDGAPLGPLLAAGLEPHFIVESSPGKWHVYWLVDELPLDRFRDVQRAIAAEFGTDKSVNDLARVMRLPGLWHQKASPFRVRIIHESGALPYSAETILARFATQPAPAPAQSAPLDAPVLADRHADVLKLTLLLAASVRAGAMTRDEAFALMCARRDAGRYSRHVPDEEIQRALDGALAKGGHVTHDDTVAPELDATLAAALQPLSPDELAEAAQPQPNAFMGGHKNQVGLFPEGEVTVIGAPGREGKTSLMVAIAEAYTVGWTVGGLQPKPDRSVLVYSAEDDRAQYARKVAAHGSRQPPERAELFRQRLLIPDLHSDALSAWREIVTLTDRNKPVRGRVVEPLIQALQARPDIGLVIFETASTLSDAEEDNAGHKTMIGALKRIAKATGAAVVLMHHTSQAASNNLPTLDISVDDIRGGTALVNNARQCFLAVNLASNRDPYPDGDARTLLRNLVARGESERISALICLNTSKGMDPPPLFFRWDITDDYGPRLVEVEAPTDLRGKPWRAVKAMLHTARAEAKADRKAEQGAANVRLVVDAVQSLTEAGELATAAKVSAKCGRSPGWAKPYLAMGVEEGLLIRSTEQVPRTVGFSDVYRLPGGALPWNMTTGQETPR